MPFTKIACPNCGKVAEATSEFKIGEKTVAALKCGHIMSTDQLNHSSPEQLVSQTGKKLYKYQIEGVKFIERSSGRILLGDEMGLGKTDQGIAACVLHPKEMCSVLAIVKSALKTQWQRVFFDWGGDDWYAQIIDSPKDHPLPGFKAYIMSYDILRRFANLEKVKSKDSDDSEDLQHAVETELSKSKGKLQQLLTKLRIKTIILDECQQIKNSASQRTIYTRAICKDAKFVIAMSGTPIKNHAGEYFPILNIIRPDVYNNQSRFLLYDCDSYYTGYGYKTAGLRYPEAFLEKNKDYIIRRERKEVLPDLPQLRRSYQFHELATEVEQAYIDEFKKFRDEYNDVSKSGFERESNILAYLSKMRHLTGLSKINPTIDYVMEIMGSTEDRVTIFVHHNDVMDILKERLDSLFVELNLPACATHRAGDQALDTERNFERARVLIASTLAGGEGLNLQKLCRRFIMHERQWNPANEKQAEDRFPRPEGIKTDFIDGVYMVAVGTVDEFFGEIVERKREIVEKTLSGKAAPWDQSSLIKELAEVLAQNGGKKWSI